MFNKLLEVAQLYSIESTLAVGKGNADWVLQQQSLYSMYLTSAFYFLEWHSDEVDEL